MRHRSHRLHRLITVRDRIDAMPHPLQHAGRDQAVGGVVLDQQDAQASLLTGYHRPLAVIARRQCLALHAAGC